MIIQVILAQIRKACVINPDIINSALVNTVRGHFHDTLLNPFFFHFRKKVAQQVSSRRRINRNVPFPPYLVFNCPNQPTRFPCLF